MRSRLMSPCHRHRNNSNMGRGGTIMRAAGADVAAAGGIEIDGEEGIEEIGHGEAEAGIGSVNHTVHKLDQYLLEEIVVRHAISSRIQHLEKASYVQLISSRNCQM